MKKPMAEAASSLSHNIHPVNLMLYLSEVGYPFEEIWPTIEEDWIEAVRAKDWNRFAPSQKREVDTIAIFAQSEEDQGMEVSDDAGLVVEKLKHKRKWGVACVNAENIQKMTRLKPWKLDMALQELLKTGLLQEKKSGAYSLDPGRQNEIDRITNIMVRKTSH
jgi:hypothetical protein